MKNGCHTPITVNEDKKLSINRGYNITKEVQQFPEEQREQAAKEAIRQLDAVVDWRTRIANVFCKAYERVETFRKIGNIIKDEILPADWHFQSPYAEKTGLVSTPNSEKSA